MLNKLLVYIISVIIIITGFTALPTVIDWINAKNVELGASEHLKYDPSVDIYKNGYRITYNLDGGVVEGNPTNYSLLSETFTLNNPTKYGCLFEGWTGTNLEEPQLNVTILAGSSGDLEFTAHYSNPIVLEKPVIDYVLGSYDVSWTATNDATEFELNINNSKVRTLYPFCSLHDYRGYFVLGTNTITVTPMGYVGSTLIAGPVSDPITFIQKKLDKPNVTIDDDLLSWNFVEDNTRGYQVVVTNSYGDEIICTSVTGNSFDLSNYSDLFQVGREYTVSVYSVGDLLYTLASEPTVVNYTYGTVVSGYSNNISLYVENDYFWFEDCLVDSSYGNREGRLYLQLESEDGRVYCFKMTDFGLDNPNYVCDAEDITIYELNRETSTLELLYEDVTSQNQFLKNTKFKLDDKYYFKLINNEPGLFSTELDCFIYFFNDLFDAFYRYRLTVGSSKGYTRANSYEFIDQSHNVTYLPGIIQYFSCLDDKSVSFSPLLNHLFLYAYGINEVN